MSKSKAHNPSSEQKTKGQRGRAPPLTIDPKDGALRISGYDIAICDRLPISTAREALQQILRGGTDHGNGYEWLNFGSVTFGGQPAWVGLCFFKGELEMVCISVDLPDDKMFENWPTEETSKRQVAFMRRELGKQLSRSLSSGHSEFSWGSVWSNFDQKGYMASAGARYARP